MRNLGMSKTMEKFAFNKGTPSNVLTVLNKLPQEMIVAAVTLVLLLIFSVFINAFATIGNAISLLQRVAIVGILGAGMAIVVIGRGIDLSQIAVMAMSSGWALWLMTNGTSITVAILLSFAFALIVGLVNGYLTAFIEIPSLFGTLASGILFFGLGQYFLIESTMLTYLPPSEFFDFIGRGTILGIPVVLCIFAFILFIVHLFLSRTSIGRFIYACGDSSDSARLTGISVRTMVLLQFIISALICCIGGLVRASVVGQVDMRVFSSSLIFEVILVVVIGGVSLIGGRGSMWSVLCGTALIGTLLNGMTMLNFQNDLQDIIKGITLLGAIILDNRLHPRDEETARQGDM
jgi:ribose transport system permease protein